MRYSFERRKSCSFFSIFTLRLFSYRRKKPWSSNVDEKKNCFSSRFKLSFVTIYQAFFKQPLMVACIHSSFAASAFATEWFAGPNGEERPAWGAGRQQQQQHCLLSKAESIIVAKQLHQLWSSHNKKKVNAPWIGCWLGGPSIWYYSQVLLLLPLLMATYSKQGACWGCNQHATYSF